MRTLAIDINDSGLVVADEQTVLAVEPGYALAENGSVTTGRAAYSQARLKPRQVTNRYWANLSVEPGTAGVGEGASAAELAFAQLEALWARFREGTRDVVFVVPGHYSREQLGLLLGLAQECGMPVRALVDAAVAASARPYPGRQLLYVDAGLHRVSVTPLEQGDEAVAQREQGLEATGLADFVDSVARWFAEVFVLATRFDPFHHARSEQQLYDRLPDWLHELQNEEKAELALPHGEEEFRIAVEREQLLGVVGGFNRAVVQLIAQARAPDQGVVVQLSERLTCLPGLSAQLARLDDAHIVRLEPGHAARAALAGLDSRGAEDGAVRLLKHLPWRERPASDGEQAETVSPPPVLADDAAAASHIVYRGVAYPIGADGVVIGRNEQEGRRSIVIEGEHGGLSRSHCEVVLRDGELKLRDLSRYGTFVNERRVAGETVLKPADVIRIGSPGAELEVVRVEGHGA